MTILIFLLVVAGLSFILIQGSIYIAGLGEILDIIWNFITGNLFGLLVLALGIFFIITFIRKMDYSKLKPVQIKTYKRWKAEKQSENLRQVEDLMISDARMQEAKFRAEKARYEAETQKHFSENRKRWQ